MKRNNVWMVVLSVSILLSSCALAAPQSGVSADYAAEEKMGIMEAAMPEAPRMESADAVYEGESSIITSGAPGADVERIVIKNADLSIAVPNPTTAMESIGAMADGMGGFIVSSNMYKTTTSQGLEVPTGNITIRVPVEKLEKAVDEIKSLVEDAEEDILSENVSGQDVTSEVTDLESRLRNLNAAEEQLLEIMGNAVRTEDVITIFRELTTVREEIEVIEGQIKYYRESAALSAVSVYLQAKAALEPISIGGWQPGIEMQKALQALVNGGQFVVDALIWLVIFALPMLAVMILPIFFIIRAIRKRRSKKSNKPDAKPKKVA